MTAALVEGGRASTCKQPGFEMATVTDGDEEGWLVTACNAANPIGEVAAWGRLIEAAVAVEEVR